MDMDEYGGIIWKTNWLLKRVVPCIFAPDKNFWGGHGIVGGQTPLGLVSYALKARRSLGLAFVLWVTGLPTKVHFMNP